MTSTSFSKSALLTLLVLALCTTTYAGTGEHATAFRITRSAIAVRNITDSVPDVKSVPETKADSMSTASAIKEVPKSKKQLAPLALPVTVKVKPITIIKPKIIRPVIRIN